MLRIIAKSKLHRLRVTDTNLAYGGSLTLDRALMEAADIVPGERVQIVNLNTGGRIETYVIEGAAGSGDCVLNGPAARCGAIGDTIHVISYALMEADVDTRGLPRSVVVGEGNRPVA